MPQKSSHPQQAGGLRPTGKIRRAHLSTQRCADAIFGARKITADQCSLLWVVWRRQGIRQNELAEELFTDPNTITAMVVRLEKRGLIRREICPEDGRARRLSLTAPGRRLVARLHEDWSEMRQTLASLFSGEEGEAALRILDDVSTVMMKARETVLEKQKKSSPRARRTTHPALPAVAAIPYA